jgi:hypothetical protein
MKTPFILIIIALSVNGGLEMYSLLFNCPTCKAVHFTTTDDEDANTLFRMGGTPIEDCLKCMELHAFAEGLK